MKPKNRRKNNQINKINHNRTSQPNQLAHKIKKSKCQNKHYKKKIL